MGWLAGAVVLSLLLPFQLLHADCNEPTKNRRQLQVLDCPAPTEVFLEATLEVQPYYAPSYCTESELEGIATLLQEHFDAFSPYLSNTGALEITPLISVCTDQNRRLIEKKSNINDKTSSNIHRNLATYGFVFKLSATCKLCATDNRDARRQLQGTVPVSIRVMTDSYPEEFSYRIAKIADDNSLTPVYESAGFFNPNTEYLETLFLEPNSRYEVSLQDLFGDGICCLEGNGFFEITTATSEIPTAILVYDSGFFGYAKEYSFVAPAMAVESSEPPSLDLVALQGYLSLFLSYYVQQSTQFDMNSCLYDQYPFVSVTLNVVSFDQASTICYS